MSLNADTIKSNYSLDFLSLNDYEKLSLNARRDYKNDILYSVDELKFDINSVKKEISQLNKEIKLKEKLVRKFGINKTRVWFNISYFKKLLNAIYKPEKIDTDLSAMVFKAKLKTYYTIKKTEQDLLINYLNISFDELISYSVEKFKELRGSLQEKLGNEIHTFKSMANEFTPDYKYTNGHQQLDALKKEIHVYEDLKNNRLNHFKELPRPKFKRDKKLTFFSWLWLTIKDYFHLFFWKQRNFFGKIKDKIFNIIRETHYQSDLNVTLACNKSCRLAIIEEYLLKKDSSYVCGSFIDYDSVRNELIKEINLNSELLDVRAKSENTTPRKLILDNETRQIVEELTYLKYVLKQLPPTRKNIERKEKATLFFKKWGQALIYVGPVLVLLGIFSFYPIVNAFRLSFLKGYNHAQGTYESLTFYENFRDVIITGNFVKPQPGTPASALINTFVITAISVPISILLALGIAAAISSIKAFKSAFQTIFFLPYITNSLAIGLVFAYIFQDKGGLFNKFLSVFGIQGGAWISVGATYYKSMFVLIVFSVWHGLAFKIMVFLSAIESIDKQYYQAAQIDKTSKFRQFRRITMPLISPTVFYIMITSLIGSLKTYTSVIAIFGVEGKPAGAPYNLKTVVFFIYDFFKTPDLFPMASAGSIILFLIILLFTVVQIQVSKRKVHY